MSSLGLHIGLGASKVLAGHVGGVENRYGHRAATPDSGSDGSFKCVVKGLPVQQSPCQLSFRGRV